MDAFDADVLIFAAQHGHVLGRRVRALFPDAPFSQGGVAVGIGSVLLLPELLSKPLDQDEEASELRSLIRRIKLLPVEVEAAELATELRSRYRLRTVGSVHLATAVRAGAERFITNNRRDYPTSITEVDVTYPDDLPEP